MDASSGNQGKRLKTNHPQNILKLNDVYREKTNAFSEAFSKKISLELENGAKVITNPFTCFMLPNFVQPDNHVKSLRNDLSQLSMKKKMNDLYQFEQSEALEKSSLHWILNFKKFLMEEVLEWMRSITKIPLAEKIDIFCSSYTQTDHLLCHDDELEGRRIAFIFYLVPEWCEKDGGTLDLFKTVDGQPSEISVSFVPKWNNFVFFEVSPISFHQVSEVLSLKQRIALSGWFHGPPLKPSIPVIESILYKEPIQEEMDITEWVNPVYLDGQTVLDIREIFEDSSEISLPDFLQKKKYDAVCEAFSDCNWEKRGPPNRRIIYEASCNDGTPDILKECQALFNSEAFLVVLSNLTALHLHPICDEDAQLGKVFSTIRKWSHGSYTLLHDQSFSQKCSLNATMYFNCPEWETEYGGYSSFVAREENEELLRVEPSSNSLALVYVAEETSHFVKYINSKSKNSIQPIFYDINCQYIEEGDNTSDK